MIGFLLFIVACFIVGPLPAIVLALAVAWLGRP